MPILILALAIAAALAAGVPAPSAAPADAWPQFRGEPALTGRAAGALPEKLKLLWTREAGGAVESSAAIADTNNAPRAPSGLFADPYGTRRGR